MCVVHEHSEIRKLQYLTYFCFKLSMSSSKCTWSLQDSHHLQLEQLHDFICQIYLMVNELLFIIWLTLIYSFLFLAYLQYQDHLVPYYYPSHFLDHLLPEFFLTHDLDSSKLGPACLGFSLIYYSFLTKHHANSNGTFHYLLHLHSFKTCIYFDCLLLCVHPNYFFHRV